MAERNTEADEQMHGEKDEELSNSSIAYFWELLQDQRIVTFWLVLVILIRFILGFVSFGPTETQKPSAARYHEGTAMVRVNLISQETGAIRFPGFANVW